MKSLVLQKEEQISKLNEEIKNLKKPSKEPEVVINTKSKKIENLTETKSVNVTSKNSEIDDF
jgi:hypothetical protein